MKVLVLSLFLLANLKVQAQDQPQDQESENQDLLQAPKLDEQDQVQAQKSDEQLMPIGLDTLGLDDSGNWVEKRVYWERAEHAFGKLRALNGLVVQLQLQYFAGRNEIDKELDLVKADLGLKISELNKVIQYLLNIAKQESSLPTTKSNKNNFRETVLDNQDQLLKLSADLDKLAQFDADLDSVVVNVIDQVQKCADYETRAWEDFKQIGRVLNDEIAKNLYHGIVNYRKNIKLILNYLKKDLKLTFEKLALGAKAQLAQIQKTMNELSDAGINLPYEFKALNQDLLKKKITEQSTESANNEPPVEPAKTKKVGFMQGVWQDFLAILLWLPRKILGWIGISL